MKGRIVKTNHFIEKNEVYYTEVSYGLDWHPISIRGNGVLFTDSKGSFTVFNTQDEAERCYNEFKQQQKPEIVKELE